MGPSVISERLLLQLEKRTFRRDGIDSVPNDRVEIFVLCVVSEYIDIDRLANHVLSQWEVIGVSAISLGVGVLPCIGGVGAGAIRSESDRGVRPSRRCAP